MMFEISRVDGGLVMPVNKQRSCLHGGGLGQPKLRLSSSNLSRMYSIVEEKARRSFRGEIKCRRGWWVEKLEMDGGRAAAMEFDAAKVEV